jgi:hypothetical protein
LHIVCCKDRHRYIKHYFVGRTHSACCPGA